MVRHLRLRQVLIAQGYTGKELRKAVAFEHRNWKEDGESLPTIEQVRKMHETLGTWDKHTKWKSWRHFTSKRITNEIYIKGQTVIHPKANYKELKKAIKKIKEARWKEQEKRILEFFEREGC